jgi:hypothetical protein
MTGPPIPSDTWQAPVAERLPAPGRSHSPSDLRRLVRAIQQGTRPLVQLFQSIHGALAASDVHGYVEVRLGARNRMCTHDSCTKVIVRIVGVDDDFCVFFKFGWMGKVLIQAVQNPGVGCCDLLVDLIDVIG